MVPISRYSCPRSFCTAVLTLCLAAVGVASVSRAAEPLPLADQVPAGVLFYTAWAGQNALPPSFADTHVSLLLGALDLPGWTDTGLPNLLPPGANANPATPLLLDLARTVVSYAWQNTAAIYSNGRGLRENLDSAPHLCFIIRFPDESAADDAERDIQDRITAIIGGESIPDIRFFRSGTLLAMTANDTTDVSPLAPLRKPLAGEEAFQDAFQRTTRSGDTPAVRVYVNLERVWLYADEDNLDNRDYDRNIAISGLKGARAIALTAGPNGPDWSSNVFVQLEAQRSGILGALTATRPASPDLLAGVPANATSVTTFSLDAADLLRRLQTEGERFSRGFGRQVLGAVNLAGAVLGVNAMDLLGNIGPDFALYALPTSPGDAKPFDYILLSKPRNAGALAQSLFTVGQSLQRLILAQRPDLPALLVNRVSTPLAEAYTATNGTFSAAWSAFEGYFVLATSETSLQTALTAMSARRLTDHAPFAAAVRRLEAPDGSSLGYADLSASLAPMHAAWAHTLTRQVPNLVRNLHHLPLPTLAQLQAHTTLAVSATWADDAGLYYRSIAPYPGAEIFSSAFGLVAGPNSVLTQLQTLQQPRRAEGDDQAAPEPPQPRRSRR